jgi:hypothetical protein
MQPIFRDGGRMPAHIMCEQFWHGTGVRGIYSHVTPAMRRHLVDALQTRWETVQPPAATGDATRTAADEAA